MSQDLKLAGSSANYHPRNNFLYIGKWKGGGQGGFTHMRAIKFNFFKLFSPCILLHCAGQESWKVDREILNSMHKLCCWNCNAVRHRAHWTGSWWGGQVQRTRSHTYYKTDNRYQPSILRKQPPVLRKHVVQATQDSSWNVPGKYKNKNGEKSNLKKCNLVNCQTGGGELPNWGRS